MQTGAAVVDLDPLVELERGVRSILNKMTPQKFDTLITKFNTLPIDTETKLKRCIELIFEKASCYFFKYYHKFPKKTRLIFNS
jgi:hypothetical protein